MGSSYATAGADTIGRESHMNIREAAALALFLAGAAAAATCGGHGTRESLFVSTQWLADHIKDANLVVLAVGGEGRLRRWAYRGIGVHRIRFGGGEGRKRTHARAAADGQAGRSVFEARRGQRFARGGLPAEGLADAGGAHHFDAGRDGARQERWDAGRQSGDVEGRRPGDLQGRA